MILFVSLTFQRSYKMLHQLWMAGGDSSAFNLVGRNTSKHFREDFERKGLQVSGVKILNKDRQFQSEGDC